MHPFGLCLPSISHESSYLLSLQLALTVFAQPPSQHWFLQNQTTSPHALLALRETLLCLLSLFLQLWDLRTALGNTALIQRLYGGGTQNIRITSAYWMDGLLSVGPTAPVVASLELPFCILYCPLLQRDLRVGWFSVGTFNPTTLTFCQEELEGGPLPCFTNPHLGYYYLPFRTGSPYP